MDWEFLLIPAIVLIVIAAIVIAWIADRGRRVALEEWAGSHGLSFDPAKDRAMDARHPEFSCLRQGRNRYAYNRIAGHWRDRDVSAFDYHYEVRRSSGKGRSRTDHYRFSAVILSSDVPLKPLAIRPENFFDKIAGFFGWEDINFESLEFSRRFHVSAPDRRWAYDVLHARAMDLLLSRPAFSLQFGSAQVIIHRSTLFSPPDFETALDTAWSLLEGMPEYLVRQQQERALGLMGEGTA